MSSQEKKRNVARRTFLRCMGAGAAALPFYSTLESSFVQAETGIAPKRLLTMFGRNGAPKEHYNRREGETATDYSLTHPKSVFSPLDDPATYGKSFKDRATILQGISLLAAKEQKTVTHGFYQRSIFSGSSSTLDNHTKNATIDQYLAVEKGLGAETRVASATLGVGVPNNGNRTRSSFGASGSPLPVISDPNETFDFLFGGLVVDDDAEARAALERERRMGKSVVDFVRKDVKRLESRLASPEKQKLEQHLTGISDLEKRLVDFKVSCTVPEAPRDFKGRVFNSAPENYEEICDLQVDLIAQAFACGVTHFGSLNFVDIPPSEAARLFPELGGKSGHVGVAHAYRPGDQQTVDNLGVLNRHLVSKIARMMQRCDEMGIADDTLVYFSSDFGNPAKHSPYGVPTILAGGLGGALQMGRFHKLTDCDDPADDCFKDQTVPNNRVLVSILQAFGVDENTFGSAEDPSIATGRLEVLHT